MQDVKRVEIIANSFELEKLLAALEQSGVRSHAVVRGVSGKQFYGGKEDLDMTMQDNVYIVAFFPPEILQQVVKAICPLLDRFGGTCHISDSIEIESADSVENKT
ncbi:MAG: P-II family nitrogen regulator [Cyanobacteria bacterium P01_F01_bin.42]